MQPPKSDEEPLVTLVNTMLQEVGVIREYLTRLEAAAALMLKIVESADHDEDIPCQNEMSGEVVTGKPTGWSLNA